MALNLERIQIHQFRNLKSIDLTPHGRITLIVGENGQGKTNLLEAVYYGLSLRSLRQAKLSDLIRQGESTATVRLTIALDHSVTQMGVRLQAAGLSVCRELQRETRITPAEDYLVAGAVVAFTPADMGLIREGPERRRRMLDRAVFNRWPAYFREATTYQRLLKNRNQLLRQHAPGEIRESFETQLWQTGAVVLARRHALLAELRPLVNAAFARIGLLDSEVTLKYHGLPLQNSHEDLVRTLSNAATEKLSIDLERGFTSVGPHVDDVVFAIGGRSARLYASQGQVRALVLALKVAEIENVRAQIGHAPLLLLDDVSSELDPKRSASFMAYLQDLPSQVLISTTDDEALSARLGQSFCRWEMSQGHVKIG